MGLMTAANLRQLGAGRVVLIERRFLGAGESGKSGAILRQHYSHVQTIRMARYSLQEFATFQERCGRDIGFHRLGMLFIAPAEDGAALEANGALGRAKGVETSILETVEMRAIRQRGTVGVVAGARKQGGDSDM